jgi:hypothetical protein
MQVKDWMKESEGRQRKMSTRFCALGQDNNVFTSENTSSFEGGEGRGYVLIGELWLTSGM